MTNITVGTKLKNKRKELNLTQERVAQLLSINVPKLSAYENDKQFPDEETLEKFCKLYKCDIDYFLREKLPIDSVTDSNKNGPDLCNVSDSEFHRVVDILNKDLLIINSRIAKLQELMDQYINAKELVQNLIDNSSIYESSNYIFEGKGNDVTSKFKLKKGIYTLEFISDTEERNGWIEIFNNRTFVKKFRISLTSQIRQLCDIEKIGDYTLNVRAKGNWTINIIKN